MCGSLSGDLTSLRNWAGQKRLEYNRYGPRALVVAAKELAVRGPLRIVGKYVWNYGTPIFERDWDLLVVLDSCRADLMQEVATEYDFLPETIPTTYSLGSYTGEWMRKNFSDTYRDWMAETVHITGNPHSETKLHAGDWTYLGEVWRAHQDSIGAVPPGPMTDYTIDASTQYDEPIITHYMQPHQPFRSLADEGKLRHGPTKDVWRLLQFGEYTREEIWEAYLDNLRWVLDELEVLLANVDRNNVVITSDHGNGLGEFGVYGHSQYIPLRPLKEVPWIAVEADDTGGDSYVTEHELPVKRDSVDTQERLKALGYVG